MGRLTLKSLFFLIIFFGLITDSSSITSSDLIKDQLNKSPNLGIYIKNITKGKVVSSYNANRRFIPASNQKIITTLCSLNYLGENYKFDSYFFIIDKKENGFTKSIVKTQGSTQNFYVDTKGDPSLKSSTLTKVVKFFKKHGLRKIEATTAKFFTPTNTR